MVFRRVGDCKEGTNYGIRTMSDSEAYAMAELQAQERWLSAEMHLMKCISMSRLGTNGIYGHLDREAGHFENDKLLLL